MILGKISNMQLLRKVAALALLLSVNTQAAELLEPDGYKPAGQNGRFFPEFTLRESYNDNLIDAPSNEIGTFVTFVQPRLRYELESSTKSFFADYQLSAATHESTRNDDYVDNRGQLGYQYTPNSRVSAGITGEYLDTRDPRGTGASQGTGVVLANPDQWIHFKVDSNFSYGAESAKGRFEADLGYIDKKYDNNRIVTAVRDREDLYGSGRFYYRIMPKTSLLLEGRATQFDYDTTAAGTTSLNSITSRALFGATWEGTFKTTGTAQIGYIRKDFETSARPSGDDISWELGIEWRPRTYSTISLSTYRDFGETNGAGNFIITDSVDLNWQHKWSERFRTTLTFIYAIDSFDEDNTGREDDRLGVGINLVYKIKNWLEVGGSYNYDERESTDNTFDFQKNIASVFTTLAF